MYINRIPKELLSDKKLGVYERMLYIAILLNSPDGKSPVRTEELMRSAGFRSRNTLKRYLRVLADKGWVEIIEQKRDRASWLTIIARNPVLDARGREAEEFQRKLARATNRGEFLMKAWLDLLVDDQDFEDNVRPDFLQNPVTGQNLEYDRLYHRGVAFEFNGAQHYGPTKRYPGKEEAVDRRMRDLIKKGLSIENRIQLIIIHPTDLTLNKISEKIGALLPLRQLELDDPLMLAIKKASKTYVRQVIEGG